MDKSVTRCFFDIQYDENTYQPTNVKMTILAGLKGGKASDLTKGEHIAFIFDYKFDKFGEVERFEIPGAVAKLLR